MAVAATSWPSFSGALLTDIAPLEALVRAIQERQSVVHAPYLSDFFRGGGLIHRQPARGIPAEAGANNLIRLAIADLALRFLDSSGNALDNPLRLGDHSIAWGPLRCTPEADPQALALYREWLANCAFWIESFRYVDVSAHSRVLRGKRFEGGEIVDLNCPIGNIPRRTYETVYGLRVGNAGSIDADAMVSGNASVSAPAGEQAYFNIELDPAEARHLRPLLDYGPYFAYGRPAP